VPATVGIIYGQIHVGLNDQQLNLLCAPDTERLKVSRRDFPSALTRSSVNGGTTVSGTLLVAQMIERHLGGVRPPLFVTGGIGGVHRGGEDTWDVSADLVELGRSSVPVLSSGVKSILDIGRTLEYLVRFFYFFKPIQWASVNYKTHS
jgi:pseudouridine-5'-phosphate glycosidase